MNKVKVFSLSLFLAFGLVKSSGAFAASRASQLGAQGVSKGSSTFLTAATPHIIPPSLRIPFSGTNPTSGISKYSTPLNLHLYSPFRFSIARYTTDSSDATPFLPELKAKVETLSLKISVAHQEDSVNLLKFISKLRADFGVGSIYESPPGYVDSDLENIDLNYSKKSGQLIILKNAQGQIVGSAGLFRINSKTGEIRKVYLAKALQGIGLGRLLFDNIFEEARKLGYEYLELETYETMRAAIRLYRSLGFKRYYPKKTPYEPGVQYYWKDAVSREGLKEGGGETGSYIEKRLKKPSTENLMSDTIESLSPQSSVSIQNEYWREYIELFQRAFEVEIRDHSKFGKNVFLPYLLQDKCENSLSYHGYEQLGVQIGDVDVRFPVHSELLENYRDQLDRLGVSEKGRIYPALTYRSYQGGGQFDYAVLSPHLDSFPQRRGFEVIDRIPDGEFQKGLSLGRMPLTNFHDLHHFIAFLIYPQFMQAMVNTQTEWKSLSMPPLVKRRIAYAFESLSLASIRGTSLLDKVLLFPRDSRKSLVLIDDYVQYFSQIDISGIKLHAKQLISAFDQFLSSYNGAGMSTTEKSLELADYKKRNEGSLHTFLGDFLGRKKFNNRIYLPRESFSEDPVMFVTKLKILMDLWERSGDMDIKGYSNEIFEQLVRMQIVRMEYFLQESRHVITLQRWVRDLLNPDTYSKPSETVEFIRNVFGEGSVTYQMLISPPEISEITGSE